MIHLYITDFQKFNSETNKRQRLNTIDENSDISSEIRSFSYTNHQKRKGKRLRRMPMQPLFRYYSRICLVFVGAFALCFIENDFAETQMIWRYLDIFVLLDVFESLFEAEYDGRDNPCLVIGSGSTHVGQLL